MTKNLQMTQAEYQSLEEKLEELKLVKRPEIIERIKIARSYGDLSENSEYESAKDEQAFLDTEIAKLEERLRSAQIINITDTQENIVSIGRTVRVLESDTNQEVVYKIVGISHADAFEMKITQESPIGKALFGHTIGDTVHVYTPVPQESYDLTILDVIYSKD
jgi:transcription elongation factor greA